MADKIVKVPIGVELGWWSQRSPYTVPSEAKTERFGGDFLVQKRTLLNLTCATYFLPLVSSAKCR